MHERVMVIDDSEIDSFLCKKMIAISGFAKETIIMRGGQNALDHLSDRDNHEKLPSVIFLDIHMPGMDGFAFLEAFEQLPENVTAACNIIMLSSSISKQEHERTTGNKHVSYFITKPLSVTKLVELCN